MTLDQNYWNQRYLDQNMGWDLGSPSPPLKEVIDGIGDKNARILIPGCGKAYEVDYLLDQGFTDITVLDIAPHLVQALQDKYKQDNPVQIICADFFEHKTLYDVILEQTFFCAINPNLRPSYVRKMHELLRPNGKLLGVLFNREFDREGPPYGGNVEEYQDVFQTHFDAQFAAPKESVPGREGFEVLVKAVKKTGV